MNTKKAYLQGWRHSGTKNHDPDNNPYSSPRRRTPEEDAWDDGYMDRACGYPKFSSLDTRTSNRVQG